jgi:uncharacterized membrane-anchored protein
MGMRFHWRGPKATFLGTALALSVAVLPAGCAVGGQDRAVQPSSEDTGFSSLGSYLSARHAEAVGDTKAAAAFYGLALEDDPDNIDLLRRAYFFSTVEGDVSGAAPLAARLMVLDPGASIASLVVSADLAQHGQFTDLATLVDKTGQQGLNGFLNPVLAAWAKAGAQDYEGAIAALNGLDANPGYLTLKTQHAALIAEMMGKEKDAETFFQSYLKSGDQPSLRGVQLAGGYLARHGRGAAARAFAAN